MVLSELKTIDIQTLEWFDKVNGNTYFASVITLNFGMDNAVTLKIPFTYGSGSQHEWESYKEINKFFNVDKMNPTYIYDNKIIIRTSKRNALKRELKNI